MAVRSAWVILENVGQGITWRRLPTGVLPGEVGMQTGGGVVPD